MGLKDNPTLNLMENQVNYSSFNSTKSPLYIFMKIYHGGVTTNYFEIFKKKSVQICSSLKNKHSTWLFLRLLNFDQSVAL